MSNPDRVKCKRLMQSIIACKSITEVHFILDGLLIRLDDLSPREIVGALRCSAAITKKSPEHMLILNAARKNLLTKYPKEQVDRWLIGLDKPHKAF